MNIKLKKICFFALLIFLFNSIPCSSYVNMLNPSPQSENPLYNTTLIVRDNNSTTPLPNRFRNLENLNISGSAEFRPLQLKNLIKVIDNKNLYIVDLRQESHGFINTLPISFYNKGNLLNKDFTTAQTLDIEKIELASIPIGSQINIYSKDGKVLENLKVDKVFSEETLVNENKINYKRFAVRDGGIPTPEVVDDFVSFVNSKPANSHLHFHCLEGQGRTTTFMSLYQMMNNKEKLTLDAILKYQLEQGGIVLTDSPKRAAFLESFYKYSVENSSSNFSTPYSTWIKSN